MKKLALKVGLSVFIVALGVLSWKSAQSQRERGSGPDPVAVGQNGATPSVAPAPPKPEEQEALRRQIERQTSQSRGLPFKRPVQYKMIERRQMQKVLQQKAQEQYSDQEMRDYSRSLAAVGLIPEGTNLLDLLLGVYGEQVAAFYVPEERSLYTFKDVSWSGSLDRMVLSHELTHALQDQNFDLTKFPLKIKDNDDLALATAALIEGDATLSGLRVYVDNVDPSKMLGDVLAMLGQNTAKLLAAPPFIRESVTFPYEAGTQFAMELLEQGGTAAIDQALAHPPVSTQQILHPDQYLRDREDLVTVKLPTIAAGSWRLVGNNVVGEFGIRSLLQPQLGVLQARTAAEGWHGDRYHVYERGTNGPTALVWRTVWRTDEAAADFAQAYQRFTNKRGLPENVVTRVHHAGRQVDIVQSADRSFFDLVQAAAPQ